MNGWRPPPPVSWRDSRSAGATPAVSPGQRTRSPPLFEPADRPVLRASAYLHDIGYSTELVTSGFHPLDGAAWLQRAGYPRLAGLVAHRSGARHEARLRGLAAELDTYLEERSDMSDALAYCDLTTGPDGQRTTFLERIAEIEARYGNQHLVTMAIRLAAPGLGEAVGRIQAKVLASRTVESPSFCEELLRVRAVAPSCCRNGAMPPSHDQRTEPYNHPSNHR